MHRKCTEDKAFKIIIGGNDIAEKEYIKDTIYGYTKNIRSEYSLKSALEIIGISDLVLARKEHFYTGKEYKALNHKGQQTPWLHKECIFECARRE